MLRKGFSIFFLFVYTLVLLKPLFPLVDYAINKDYIAKNLCENRNKPKMNCNGKCHLMKQLKKASTGTTSEGNTTKNSQNQEENVFHISSFFYFNIETSKSKLANHYLNTFSNKLPSSYLADIFHPPKFS
jgi:hypothetical protein